MKDFESSPVDAVVRPPLGVAINESVRCSEVYRTDGCLAEPLVGYAISSNGRHEAYGRSGDGSLIDLGTFDRHDDAIECILRTV